MAKKPRFSDALEIPVVQAAIHHQDLGRDFVNGFDLPGAHQCAVQQHQGLSGFPESFKFFGIEDGFELSCFWVSDDARLLGRVLSLVCDAGPGKESGLFFRRGMDSQDLLENIPVGYLGILAHEQKIPVKMGHTGWLRRNHMKAAF